MSFRVSAYCKCLVIVECIMILRNYTVRTSQNSPLSGTIIVPVIATIDLWYEVCMVSSVCFCVILYTSLLMQSHDCLSKGNTLEVCVAHEEKVVSCIPRGFSLYDSYRSCVVVEVENEVMLIYIFSGGLVLSILLKRINSWLNTNRWLSARVTGVFAGLH